MYYQISSAPGRGRHLVTTTYKVDARWGQLKMDMKTSISRKAESQKDLHYQNENKVCLRIVIPCRNRLQRLTRCLASIQNAINHKPDSSSHSERIEVVVVNDRSNPGFCEHIESAFPFVNIQQSRKPGPGAARNTALDTTNTDCFVFTDSDCVVAKDFILQAQNWYLSSKSHMAQGIPWLYQLDQNAELGSLEQSLYRTMFSSYVEGNTSTMVDSRCMLIRKSYFDFFKLHPFEDSTTEAEAEERIRIGELISDGLQIDWVPQLKVYHEDPMSLSEVWRQKYRHGRGRINLWSKLPMAADLLDRYFILPITRGNDPSYVLSAHLAFLMGYRDALQFSHQTEKWWANLLDTLANEFSDTLENLYKIEQVLAST